MMNSIKSNTSPSTPPLSSEERPAHQNEHTFSANTQLQNAANTNPAAASVTQAAQSANSLRGSRVIQSLSEATFPDAAIATQSSSETGFSALDLTAALSWIGDPVSTFNKLSDETLGRLDAQMINRLSDAALKGLSARVINKLSDEALGRLDAQVVNRLSDAALKELSARVINKLSDEALGRLDVQVISLISENAFRGLDRERMFELSSEALDTFIVRKANLQEDVFTLFFDAGRENNLPEAGSNSRIWDFVLDEDRGET